MGKRRNRSKQRKKEKAVAQKTNTHTTGTGTVGPGGGAYQSSLYGCFGHAVTRVVRLNDHAYLWGGSEAKMRSTMQGLGYNNPRVKFVLGFDLSGFGKLYQSPSLVDGSSGAQEMLGKDLFQKGNACEAVSIDWADGGTPLLSKRWWELLASRLVKMEGHVAVNCYGGHGRTGTFLAIIACLLDEVPYTTCPVHWVRDKYGCDSAVETMSQCLYIKKITGRDVTSIGSNTPVKRHEPVVLDKLRDETKGLMSVTKSYIQKVKDAAAASGFNVTGGEDEGGGISFEVKEEDADAFETWLTDYDDRFDSVEVEKSPDELAPWERRDDIFGDDGYDEWGNTEDDYRAVGWMI